MAATASVGSTAVTLGPGHLYVAPIGTTEPVSASATLASAWRDIGYTDAGNTFSNEFTSEDVEVAEELAPVATVATGTVITIAFAMAETTRANLALALGLGANAANSAASLDFPDASSRVSVMIVFDTDPLGGVTGGQTGGATARYIFRSCLPTGTIELASQKAPQKRLLAPTFSVNTPTGNAQPWTVFPNSAGLV